MEPDEPVGVTPAEAALAFAPGVCDTPPKKTGPVPIKRCPQHSPGVYEVKEGLSETHRQKMLAARWRSLWQEAIRDNRAAEKQHDIVCGRLEEWLKKKKKTPSDRTMDKRLDDQFQHMIKAKDRMQTYHIKYLNQLCCVKICENETLKAKLRSVSRRVRRKKLYGIFGWKKYKK